MQWLCEKYICDFFVPLWESLPENISLFYCYGALVLVNEEIKKNKFCVEME